VPTETLFNSLKNEWIRGPLRDPRPRVPKIRLVLIPSHRNISHCVHYYTDKLDLKA